MSNRSKILQSIEDAVFEGRGDEVGRALREASDQGVPAQQVVAALTAGMERVRAQVGAGALATAEVLVAAEAFRDGVRALEGGAGRVTSPQRAGVVIGVVPGDVHDLGKNIVAVVLESVGHSVVDVGREAGAEAFIAAIEATEPRPAIAALSTMMSTTLENLRQVVGELRRFDPSLTVVAGGAALDARVARALGADGYADSAATAPDEISRLLAAASRA